MSALGGGRSAEFGAPRTWARRAGGRHAQEAAGRVRRIAREGELLPLDLPAVACAQPDAAGLARDLALARFASVWPEAWGSAVPSWRSRTSSWADDRALARSSTGRKPWAPSAVLRSCGSCSRRHHSASRAAAASGRHGRGQARSWLAMSVSASRTSYTLPGFPSAAPIGTGRAVGGRSPRAGNSIDTIK